MLYFSSGDDSGRNPDWYWTRGLHDALILGVEARELQYDVTLRNPVRNVLIIHLDAKAAMFDTAVTAIRLYNYRVLTDTSDMDGCGEGLKDCCWMQDRLRWEKGKYLLDITALGKYEFHYIVRFDFAGVERK